MATPSEVPGPGVAACLAVPPDHRDDDAGRSRALLRVYHQPWRHATCRSCCAICCIPGFWYSGTILAILGCHEFGHYFACRYYDVDASLPFFLPAPLPLTGTLGAFIRIREPIPTKRMLFDIGIAGPIAGFLVALPRSSSACRCRGSWSFRRSFTGVELGEPLLFQVRRLAPVGLAARRLFDQPAPDGVWRRGSGCWRRR